MCSGKNTCKGSEVGRIPGRKPSRERWSRRGGREEESDKATRWALEKEKSMGRILGETKGGGKPGRPKHGSVTIRSGTGALGSALRVDRPQAGKRQQEASAVRRREAQSRAGVKEIEMLTSDDAGDGDEAAKVQA